MPVTTKPGVRFGVITADLVYLLQAVLALADRPDVPAEGLVITAGTNGHHMTGSKHYTGQAIDLRSKSFVSRDKQAFTEALRRQVGPLYTVLLESEGLANEHWHLQRRKGA